MHCADLSCGLSSIISVDSIRTRHLHKAWTKQFWLNQDDNDLAENIIVTQGSLDHDDNNLSVDNYKDVFMNANRSIATDCV